MVIEVLTLVEWLRRNGARDFSNLNQLIKWNFFWKVLVIVKKGQLILIVKARLFNVIFNDGIDLIVLKEIKSSFISKSTAE